MKTTNYSKLAHLTTIISFVTGTILFISFKVTHNFWLTNFGLKFIITAFVINLIVISVVLSNASIYDPNRGQIIFSGLLMLINIPIALLYLQLL
jgi:hypothetical protein